MKKTAITLASLVLAFALAFTQRTPAAAAHTRGAISAGQEITSLVATSNHGKSTQPLPAEASLLALGNKKPAAQRANMLPLLGMLGLGSLLAGFLVRR